MYVYIPGYSYLLVAPPGGWCPKSGETWRCQQPANQRKWGGIQPAPACPDLDADSAPEHWTAAAQDHTNATVSPEYTEKNQNRGRQDYLHFATP